MDSFPFVRPTGQPMQPGPRVGPRNSNGQVPLGEAVPWLAREGRHPGDQGGYAGSNLVLWGDPQSNRLLAKLVQDLPVSWTAEKLSVGEKTFAADGHMPVMIYPNPLNPKRYVVLNSSFTYREYAYLNNARQVPMLPDWAIVDLSTPPGSQWPGRIVDANFFDEKWGVK
ncbi:MAG: hypothetical protein CM1200mP2_20230 [Planctomycetaceae bacterium]|nr:MAG: hypothetical protein CM1200mP2_20230 [Planctomycetaceae bacterium]